MEISPIMVPRIDIIVAVIVIAFATMLLLRKCVFGKSSNRTRGDLALVLGPCGSGKTTLFMRWSLPNSQVKTVTSQSANRGKVLTGCPLEIVDFPGHPRLWHGALSLLPRAQRVVFIIDATSSDMKAVAESLYDIFVAQGLRDDCKLMICRNKTDISKSCVSESQLVNTINTEIEILRKSRPQALDGENGHDQYLGVLDEPFDISLHAPIDVSFGSSSVAKNKIAEIESFLVA
jgi:signal recognition particle receptor subunit beta